MRIYISGPISGHDIIETKWRFAKAEQEIKRCGHDVINPIDMADWCLSWRAYMGIAKVTLLSGDVDMIYVMPGWSHSRGCRLEIRWAIDNGIPVIYSLAALPTIEQAPNREGSVVYAY